MSESITKGKLVTFHFTMFSLQGDILGSSENQTPLTYLHGLSPIEPPGLATHLEGKELGYTGEVILGPEEAYGERLLPAEESMDQIPKSQFGTEDIQPGMMFMANIGGKGDLPITVIEVKDEVVVVYYGHPLAGETLRFELRVMDVRDPTAEELKGFAAE